MTNLDNGSMENSNKSMKPAFDPIRFKEQERAGFNMIAGRYEVAMGTVLDNALNRLLELADLHPGLRVLDVATGPGLVARAVARALGSTGEVVGVDIAEETLIVARQRAADAGLTHLSFQVEDAEALSLPDNSFDRVICSQALMHFPDAEKALQEMYRVLKPGGRIVVCVWGAQQEVPFIQVALQTLARNFPPPKVERPSMFRFGQFAVLEELVCEAGFVDVKIEKRVLPIKAADPADYWDRFLSVAGITTVVLSKQPPEVNQKLEKDVATDLAPYFHDGLYHLDSTIMIATGVK
ncbi:MAG TPA: methyltransferase domain-containing protein [Chloroflexia bacterium]|nr:methyltransferase domain-containing protein [Chloroflexia bacterium]